MCMIKIPELLSVCTAATHQLDPHGPPSTFSIRLLELLNEAQHTSTPGNGVDVITFITLVRVLFLAKRIHAP